MAHLLDCVPFWDEGQDGFVIAASEKFDLGSADESIESSQELLFTGFKPV